MESSTGAVRTYYQAANGSVIEIIPNFPATLGYTSSVLIPAGVAKTNTPLAAISWGSFDEVTLSHSHSHSPIFCFPIPSSSVCLTHIDLRLTTRLDPLVLHRCRIQQHALAGEDLESRCRMGRWGTQFTWIHHAD